MRTDRLFPTLSLALSSSLVLGSTACVGFINGDDGSDDETAGDGDGDTGEAEGDGDGDSGDTTIFAIQQGEIGEGMIVTVAGVIVTSPVNAEEGLAFIEEPGGGEYSGISLYMWDEVVMTTPLLIGTDGHLENGQLVGDKMSKSKGNYIGIEEPPKDMYGKAMSIADALMWNWYELLSDKPSSEVAQLKSDVEAGREKTKAS